MAITRPTLIGVFDEPAMADDAINALEGAGFGSDQIYYSGRGTSNGFFAGLKELFTGETANTSADLQDLGLSREEADYYQNEYRAGRGIVAVNASGREQDVLSTMKSYGARIYGTQNAGSQYTQDNGTYANDAAATDTYNNNDRTDRTYNQGTDTYNNDRTDRTYNQGTDTYNNDADATDNQQRMRLREEQLNVGKERVQAGEARLHKNVVEEEKNIDVPVSHEEVYVERRPVADSEIDNSTPINEEEDIRVPVNREDVNVSKDTVTTGEVVMGKRNVQENRRVSDTVKREEANLNQDGDIPVNDRSRERMDTTDRNQDNNY